MRINASICAGGFAVRACFDAESVRLVHLNIIF